jgi:hypothetical protein
VLDGFSAADALDLVNRSWIFELSWAGQEPTSMELTAEHDGGEVCVSVGSEEGAAGTVRFGATVSLSTGDGKVNASFPVSVSAEPGDGGVGQVHLWNDAPYGSLVPLAQMPGVYGELGVDLSGYDLGGIEFGGAFAPYDEPGSADGSLTILGGMDPQCAGGSDDDSSEGCPGVDITEVARAEWGNTGVEP